MAHALFRLYAPQESINGTGRISNVLGVIECALKCNCIIDEYSKIFAIPAVNSYEVETQCQCLFFRLKYFPRILAINHTHVWKIISIEAKYIAIVVRIRGWIDLSINPAIGMVKVVENYWSGDDCVDIDCMDIAEGRVASNISNFRAKLIDTIIKGALLGSGGSPSDSTISTSLVLCSTTSFLFNCNKREGVVIRNAVRG